MPVVVDASAVGAIAFGEPDGPTIRAHLEGETLIAPTLIDYELMNVAVKKARKRPETAGQLWLARSRDIELVTLDRILGRLAADQITPDTR